MRGYWGDDELSQAVLSRDIVPGEYLYKTGGPCLPDDRGLYVYAGRAMTSLKRERGTGITRRGGITHFAAVDVVAGAVCSCRSILGGRLGIAAFVEAPPGLTAANCWTPPARSFQRRCAPTKCSSWELAHDNVWQN